MKGLPIKGPGLGGAAKGGRLEASVRGWTGRHADALMGGAGFISDLNKGIALVLGGAVLALGASHLLSGQSPPSLSREVFKVLGWVFPSLLVALVLIGLVSVQRLLRGSDPGFWRQVGLQAASCVATLALTCTLLGISLRIGGLADRALTPETVTEVIGDLTRHFSLAFMTTVIGLPVSALLRSTVLILSERTRNEGRAA